MGCSTIPVASSDDGSEPQAAFHQLAGLEVTSDRLYQSIADQADVTGFSHQVEVESDLASPFTPSEMERIAQSFVHSLKVMLFDLAPEHFWESHLAEYYASTLSTPRSPAAWLRGMPMRSSFRHPECTNSAICS